MKNKILILATVALSMLSFAGTKEDYESAYKKYESTQNVEQYAKDLEKFVSKNKPDIYVNSAKMDLASIELSKNNQSKALMYLKQILDDKSLDIKDRESILKEVYNLTDSFNEKVKILDELLSINNINVYNAEKIILYNKSNKKEEAKKIYNSLEKKLNNADKLELNSMLIEKYINDNQLNDAKDLAMKLEKNSDNNIKLTGKYYLGIIEAANNEFNKAITYLEEASKLSKMKNIDVEMGLFNIYSATGNDEKALEKATLLKNSIKTADTYLDVVFLAEKLNKTKIAEDTIKELKSKQDLDKKDLSKVNYALAREFANAGLDKIAEKYAIKAIKEDKEEAANVVLAIVYGRKGNKKEALKYLELAKKANVSGLEVLEKQINELK